MRTLMSTVIAIFLSFAAIQAEARFIVRTVFFKPANAKVVPENRISNIVKDAQKLYADEMALQGYGRKTFKYEEKVDGDVRVHTVNGRFNSFNYADNTYEKILLELPDKFNPRTPPWDKQDEIFIIIVGGVASVNGSWGFAWPHHSNRYGGVAVIAAESGHLNKDVIAHELGHCFGLYHKPPGSDPDPPSLEQYEARWLDNTTILTIEITILHFPKL